MDGLVTKSTLDDILSMDHKPPYPPKYDVVFVHGVHGTKASSQRFIELFRKDDDRVRVLSFTYYLGSSHSESAYNSHGLRARALLLLQGIRNMCHETDALILIAQDFGGILAKKAIALAYDNPSLNDRFLRQIYAMVTMPPPPFMYTGRLTLVSSGILQLAQTLTDLTIDVNAEFYHTVALVNMRVANVFSKAAAITDRSSENSHGDLFTTENLLDLSVNALDVGGRLLMFPVASSIRPLPLKKADLDSPTREIIRNLVKHPALCQPWRLAHMSIVGRDIAEEQDSKCPLAVAASIGLEDVVDHFLQEQKPDCGDLAGAINEAARNNSVQALRTLLKARTTLGVDAVNAAIQAAEFNPNVSILLELLRCQPAKDLSDITVAGVLRGVCIFRLNDMMQYLIESNALDAHPSLTAEVHPLHLAAKFNTIGIVRQLCHAGIDPMAVDDDESTALHTAALYNSLGVVDILLQASGDLIGARNKANLSALQVACQAGSHSVARCLIQAGGVMSYANDKYHPMLFAVREEHKVCVQIVLESLETSQVSGVAVMPLLYAVVQNELAIARLLLRAGANPNPPLDGRPWPTSPLYYATIMPKLEMVELLLESNAAVNQPDPDTGNTPLFSAACLLKTEMVRCLVKSKADVNLCNKDGLAPLHGAASQGHLGVTELLLEANADPNVEDEGGWRPLHKAHNHAEVTRLLLAQGADINAICDHGSPLYLASDANQPEVVQVLLTHNPPPNLYYEKNGFSSLAVAIRDSSTEITALLLKAGVDVNRKLYGRFSPLMVAVERGCEATVQMILEYQPELNWKTDDGFGALHCMMEETPVSLVERLIRRGVDPDLTNARGASIIWTAVEVKNLSVARYLASVVKVKLDTPVRCEAILHSACRYDSLAMVRILADAGADVNLACPGVYGTPLQAACRRTVVSEPPGETLKILQYLIEKGAQVNARGGDFHTCLHMACFSSTPEVIKFFLTQGAEVDCEDSVGRTPAHIVCYRGQEHYQILNPSTSQLVARDWTQRTALHYAVMSGDLELVQRVLDSHKCDPDHRDTYRQLVDDDLWTPLHWAARSTQAIQEDKKDTVSVIKYLLEEGYDLTAKGKAMNQEWTALDVAIYHGADEEIKTLLIPVKSGEHVTFTQRRPGKRYYGDDSFCYICLADIVGFCLECLSCEDFIICFKCQASRHILHPKHEFSQTTQEYDSEVEEWEPPGEYVISDSPVRAEPEMLAQPAFDGEVLDFGDSDEDDTPV
ncbi:ankyrin repeat-containing domain protein [Penicillium concentricum]|uniref:Ankyrin repeat-containing domain protein n=1 Tax=Penicillium concentricum TaxID=293559 RepID=A0A9W9VAM0_9EURO|nr:ankyrin repeat-containing domain protein [Penicillium concentricum]KAJ5372520.1 ankyrin repeat-containing domain protein [Penicillium concentricum]